MKRLTLTTLSVLALITVAAPAMALTDRFDDSRQEMINKLSDRFDDSRQEMINK
ncbi:MAG: hypothetical protein HC769_14690 [Cyanobacteria bacterium CRU_2_1]|nr:hypothetical protein [Cyanobacteria bacterium RU_5_0]NJR59970.1 hypothetical protein [Cyanobacteria bacterium CRU_2_1]